MKRWNCFKLSVNLLEPPINNWREIHGFFLFERQNSSNWKDATWIFLGNWISDLMNSKFHKWIGIDSHIPDELQFNFRLPNNYVNFRWFAFEKWILLMQNSIFFKKSEISGLKLLFQMTSYHGENVQFWWLTRRWIAENLNFWTHCLTLSQLCFPLISVEKSVETLYGSNWLATKWWNEGNKFLIRWWPCTRAIMCARKCALALKLKFCISFLTSHEVTICFEIPPPNGS